MYTPELEQYVRVRLSQGVSYDAIRQELLHNNWSPESIDSVFSVVGGQPSPIPQDGKRIMKGVLWIISPLILLILGALLNLIVHFAGADNDVFRIFSLILGVAGVLLFIAGPIIGIMILVKKS